ncbi:hypothetical protein CP97_14746 [Aurantiacibacter atlanticus]|uniref:Uncharacterized protein n=1 Tax=Aurantiacibacter atlanticus TaxID=1648404 RepID=A0A161IA03_9SPHN|nr:hypothetical protein CP97_14746 [Aurantiacibacter atlanticus]
MHRANEIERTAPWRLRLELTRKDAESALATYGAGFVATLAFFS